MHPSIKDIKESNDVIVVNDGSNDVKKNNTNVALFQITKCIQNISNTNIIILSILHRYDLTEYSCVNKEFKEFN